MLTNNVMALKGKRARWVAGLNGTREYENIFLLWQNKEFLETEVFKEYQARITQMGVLYVPIMVPSILAAGSALTHPDPSPELCRQHRGTGPASLFGGAQRRSSGLRHGPLSPNLVPQERLWAPGGVLVCPWHRRAEGPGWGELVPAGRADGEPGAAGARGLFPPWEEENSSCCTRLVSLEEPTTRASHLLFTQHHVCNEALWGARELTPAPVLRMGIVHRRVRVGRDQAQGRARRALGVRTAPTLQKTRESAFLTCRTVLTWLPLLGAVTRHRPASGLGLAPCFPSRFPNRELFPCPRHLLCPCASALPRISLSPSLSKIHFSWEL